MELISNQNRNGIIIIPIILITIIIVLFSAYNIKKIKHDKTHPNTHVNPNKKPSVYVPPKLPTDEDINQSNYVNLMDVESINNMINNSHNNNNKEISNTLLETVHDITPEPFGYDIIDEDGECILYYRCLPITVKYKEKHIWLSATNKIALHSEVKGDITNKVTFNRDGFVEFVANVSKSLLYKQTYLPSDVVAIMMIKIVYVHNENVKNFIYYDKQTYVVYIIKIYYDDLEEIINEKWVSNLLNNKLTSYLLN